MSEEKFGAMSLQEKRLVVARYLNLNPDDESDWPIELLDRLIAKRERDGLDGFVRDVWDLMGL